VVVATPNAENELTERALQAACREHLPAYMVPAKIDIRPGPLPRNPNGKIDRKSLAGEFAQLFEAG
jgi:acyl-CoA synthetase (AMP-forming)/AMP-acid ligase II